MTFVPLTLAVPFVVLTLTRLNVLPGVKMESFAIGPNVFVVFCAMLKLSGFAIGGMFVTLTVMVELFVPPTLSVMV